MRIPLDYYRILGLPIQATTEQLKQAHRDRTLQLPRREYSDAAIAARKQLLDKAYVLLSNPEQRQLYDANFLAKTYDLASESESTLPGTGATSYADDPDLDPHAPSIEIDDQELIGALLVLQELGEYELVLKLGRPFLSGGSASLKGGQYGDPAIVFSDIVLTVALACLELGREQWQQGQYENAAEALETGQQLLMREGLFVGVRGEIQSDLYKLRPYRVLELLAVPEDRAAERQQGIQLLQDILNDRGGIDGAADDQSGLNIDDFLRFIQQLRSYLTAEEQQTLFEQEASRPSAVATYLAVYALLSRGFADRQAELIYRAKRLLARLSGRQDVYLEKAVCALLLGQTEEASQALELSQEREPIAFIREHSQGAPDLLPGLCLYTERWLQDEVFPHFRDLVARTVSLKDYFADLQVQAYLEDLPSEAEIDQALPPVRSQPISPSTATLRSTTPTNTPVALRSNTNGAQPEPMLAAGSGRYLNRDPEAKEDPLLEVARNQIAAQAATVTLGAGNRSVNSTTAMPEAERVSHPVAEPEVEVAARAVPDRVRSRGERPPTDSGQRRVKPPAPPLGGDRPARPRSARPSRWLLPGLVLLGIAILGFLGVWALRSGQAPIGQTNSGTDDQPLVRLDQPLVELPPEALVETADPAKFDQAAAQQVIESWLAAKAKAMGSTHEIDQLDRILLEPKLSEWRSRAEREKQNNSYVKYTHAVKVESVNLSATTPETATGEPNQLSSPPVTSDAGLPSPTPILAGEASPAPTTSPSSTAANPTQATVIAEVSETLEPYRDGQAEAAPETDNLRVQYNLVFKDGQWWIQDWMLQ
ncbi:IMS domain-containing protein [Pantanalinema rosaneae CENA516]|uniref:IMS domain-containing protein n=1 Tax=Pantanalinema rosaneae TaxID=1620701 RepID=UPI003D6EDDF8